MLTSMGFLFFYNQILEIFILLVPRFQRYLTAGGGMLNIGGITILWIFYIVIIMWNIFIANWETEEKKREVFRNNYLVYIYIAFTIIGTRINFFDRLGWYFRPLIMLVIPDFISNFSEKSRIIIYFVVFIVFLIFMIINIVTNFTIRYSFFW